MKNKSVKVIVLVCVILIGAGLFVAARQSDEWAAWQGKRDAAATQAQQQLVTKYEDLQKTSAARESALHDGCVAGQKAYDLLTPIQRAAATRAGVVRATCE
jgi:hypothetical protein